MPPLACSEPRSAAGCRIAAAVRASDDRVKAAALDGVERGPSLLERVIGEPAGGVLERT